MTPNLASSMVIQPNMNYQSQGAQTEIKGTIYGDEILLTNNRYTSIQDRIGGSVTQF